jgi:hypothetical protein
MFHVTRDCKSLWWSPWEDPEFHRDLSEAGVEFTESDRADLVLVCTDALDKAPKRPLVIMDHYDRASVLKVEARRLLNTPRVRALIRNSHYVDPNVENTPHFEGSLFGVEALKLASAGERPCGSPGVITPPISPEGLAKIHAVNNVVWAFYSDFFDVPLDPRTAVDNMDRWRPIDIMCLMSADHYNLWTPRWHRAKAFEALAALPRDVVVLYGGTCANASRAHQTRFGAQPNRHIHYRLMRQSKIALSPFGYSELSKRDYEAIAAGCVLLKPYCDYLLVWPPQQSVGCALDFSDLTQVVEGILNNWKDHHRQEACDQSELYRRYRADRAMLAQHYVDIFQKAIK